ncbi:RNA polymerase sigma factor [Serinicoccus kebangsaanensis]|uniref:RNA polymerase sigma factor n=1 Tax=Serinicoccus kebangsaanensis TaxID=2602069 RepID=UPI00178C2AC8|nr:sigma-70 family RNA polymerase sigma factor [Serinicoccus kebangsaanensis]
MPSTTDGPDLQLLQQRDPDAWEALYRQTYPMMRGYAARRAPAGADPDDLVSEAMARALDRIDTFEDRGVRIQAWLFGVLRHVVLEHVRSSSRSQAADLDTRADQGRGPLQTVLHEEESAAVRAGFARLSDDDQEVLWFRVVAGLTAAETATLVGRREGAVRQAQSRALTRLRTTMQEVHP